jgi:hypothetical protein
MKAEHRHELKTNELVQWLNNFPQWVKTNAKTIIAAVVILVAAISVFLFNYYKEKQVYNTADYFTSLISQLNNSQTQIIHAASQGQDVAFQLLGIADELQTAAQTFQNPEMISIAYTKSGDAIRSELHYRQITPAKNVAVEQIEKALTAYNNALEKGSDKPAYLAAAKFGIAISNEELQKFEDAKKLYNEILQNPDFKPTVAYKDAAKRLKIMDQYASGVTFKSAPMPAQTVEPQLQPQIQIQAPEPVGQKTQVPTPPAVTQPNKP